MTDDEGAGAARTAGSGHDRITIDFLFWRECPSHPEALERLKRALNRSGIKADVSRIEIRSEEEAVRHRFVGSPTIRMNGRDMDSEAVSGQPFRLTCRIFYDSTGRVVPIPSEESIQRALQEALKRRKREEF